MSTESTDLTRQISSSFESPAVSSKTTTQSQSSGHRPSTTAMSTSGSVVALSLTDSTSAPRQEASTPTAYATQPSATPSDSSSRTTDSSNNNLSKGGQIAIGVVVPVLTLIAGLVFGIRAWSRQVSLRRSSKREEGGTMGKNAIELQQRNGQETLPPRRQMTDTAQDLNQSWI